MAESTLRIAIVAPLDLAGHGGVETHILCLAESLRIRGHEVDVYGRNADTQIPARFHSFYKTPINDFLQYDIVHTHGCSLSWRFVPLALRLLPQQQHVHTLHGVSLDYLWACKAWLNWRCYTATMNECWASWHADGVIAVSERVARWARRCFGLGKDKIEVIYNGHNFVSSDGTARAAWRKQLNIPETAVVAIFVGRGEDRIKGTERIAAAMDELHQRHRELYLLAVPGSGFSEAPWLRRSGPIEHGRISALYEAADIFINASLTEGLPLTLLEAMAAGLAIVAAPVGGIPEIIEPGRNGLLLRSDHSDLAACLEQLLAPSQSAWAKAHPTAGPTSDAARQMGTQSRQDAQRFTWACVAEHTEAYYRKLLTSE